MQYWIILNGQQTGPFRLEELERVPGFGPDTPVWREGMPDWKAARLVPETAAILGIPLEMPPSSYCHPEPQRAAYAPGGENPGEVPPMPPTYLVWAILSTICCCLPVGVVAIIYASKVSPLYYRGDYEGSLKASEKAGWWSIGALVAGLVWAPFYTLYTIFAGL